MSLILNIDTSTETAHVSIAKAGNVLRSSKNESQTDHASFLQPAIQQLVKDTGIALTDIDAIAVTAGPGSYTGLRVGMASAKGLCYALNKPLIMLNTLEVLTASAIRKLAGHHVNEHILFCPMIDARRMEVFTAIYDPQLATILPPQALILEEQSFKEQLINNPLIFFGSGSAKWNAICHDPNASFEMISILPEAMSSLSNLFFSRNQFADLAYSEPFYLKEFQTVIKK
jgi:tRNA threonylcarbamoyladenosine biosynthesis protein TsaB